MGTFRIADIVRSVLGWVVGAVALALSAALLPGFSADSFWPLLLGAVATAVVGALVRPVFISVAAAIGWVAVALVAVAGQAVILMIVLPLLPGVHVDSFWSALAAAWLAAIIGTALAWLASAGTDDSFALALRKPVRGLHLEDPDVDGVVFVQLDGVSHPVMSWALRSGTMPNARRWVDAGSHALSEWLVQLPCTTPASQQAILHGSSKGIPAFRWYDRQLGRVLVANRPADAAIIEQRVSDGRGLLADGGVSVSNLFTGDAVRAAMTMSRMEVSRGSRTTREVFARFLARPDGLARSVARTVTELVRERFQAVRQRRLDVRPRVPRPWTFAALRAFSNGLLRDMNTAVVAEAMMHGARSVYVDYVDYDEIAHHAGATRLESVAALTGLDQVLGLLAQVAEAAPRRYHLVVLSDHGQSQGQPFADRYDVDLAGLCAQLAEAPVAAVEQSVEAWGRVGLLVDDLGSSGSPSRRIARSVSKRVDTHTAPGAPAAEEGFVVLGSGNLGLVYVPGPERLLLEELEPRWPALVPGLAAHPGIGFVAVLTRTGPVALGARGSHDLQTGEVTGEDPLAPFGAHAAVVLRDAVLRPEAPDIYVNSALDPGTDEVAAFEELVGCHGGLGGWQDRGFVLAPADLLDPAPPIVGGEQLHRRLVGILESLGQRTDLAAAPTTRLPTTQPPVGQPPAAQPLEA